MIKSSFFQPTEQHGDKFFCRHPQTTDQYYHEVYIMHCLTSDFQRLELERVGYLKKEDHVHQPHALVRFSCGFQSGERLNVC